MPIELPGNLDDDGAKQKTIIDLDRPVSKEIEIDADHPNHAALIEGRAALNAAVKHLWENGASFDDIDDMFDQALEKANAHL